MQILLVTLCTVVALSSAYPAYYEPPTYYQPHYPSHHSDYHHQPEHYYSHPKPKHDYAHKEHDYGHPTPYHFEYGVADHYHGTRFDRHENSDGDVVKGSYSVDLPDGRTQHVHYTADHYGGFNAKVTYEGKAYHPTHGYEHAGYNHYQ